MNRLIKKILFLTDSTEHGGAEDHLKVLAGEFYKRRHEVRVLLPVVEGTTELVSQLRQRSIETSPLPLVPLHPGAIRQTRKAVLLNILCLYRCFLRSKPDLLHFVMSWPTRDNWCGMVAALLLGIPYVVDFQLVPPSFECPPTNRGLLKYLDRLLRFVFNRADRLICVSEGNKKRLSTFFKIGERRIEVVHNCVDVEFYQNPDVEKVYQLRHEFNLPQDRIVVTMVARLNVQKGHRYLIEAAKSVAAKNPKIVFLLVGDGELRNELEMITKKAGLGEKFIFMGYRQDIPEILSLTDIFVLPTKFEGLPHSLLEAMAAGRCVIASRVDGVDELVSDGNNGILVEAGNVHQLTETLIYLINRKDEREKMGRKARLFVSESFSLDRMIQRIESIYATILSG